MFQKRLASCCGYRAATDSSQKNPCIEPRVVFRRRDGSGLSRARPLQHIAALALPSPSCCPPLRSRCPGTFPVVVRLEDARDAADPHAAEPHHSRVTCGTREGGHGGAGQGRGCRENRRGSGTGAEGPYPSSRCWARPTRRRAAPAGGWKPRGCRR